MSLDWKQVSSALREQIGSSWLPNRIEKRLLDDRLVVFVACSGGADSLFLLLATHGWLAAEGQQSRLRVLHFNHRLRGDESEGDESFVREIAEKLEIDISVSRWERENETSPVSEDQAREARMAFFAECISSTSEKGIILTGHHCDDIPESMLMRLSRGSGLQGLSSPRSISKGFSGILFARPLLNWRKREIIDQLRGLGAVWREDETNFENHFYRNRLRNKVIAEWEAASDRPIHKGVALSRELLEEDFLALEETFNDAWRRVCLENGRLSLAGLQEEPRAVQRRALQKLCIQFSDVSSLGADIMRKALDVVELGNDLAISISKRYSLVLDRCENSVSILDLFREGRVWGSFNLPFFSRGWLPVGGRITARICSLESEVRQSILIGEIPHTHEVYLRLPGARALNYVKIRHWESGDSYRPYGKTSAKKLGELFIENKIPKENRYDLPLFLAQNDDILWVPGLPPNSEFIINEGTIKALQLTYQEAASRVIA